MPDMQMLAAAAHGVGGLLLVDATVATRIHCRPSEHGADLVLHSATKYLKGHGDMTAGVLVLANAGRLSEMHQFRTAAETILTLFNEWLLLRGLRTLAIRMGRASSTDFKIAGWLSNRDEVKSLHYPGLTAHPQHHVACRQYIRRPDLGRCISQQSTELLRSFASEAPAEDVVIVVAYGLSSSAVTINAVPLIERLVPALKRLGLTVRPIMLAAQARVAIADPIGEALGSRIAIILIGERPGLSAADSLGAYITYGPKTGTQDSDRNCVSNIREAGLSIDAAAANIIQLVQDIARTSVSGVALKSAMVAIESVDL